MLGNDVVDLEDVDARPETFRRRFDARVFSDEERRAIAADPDPQARRWAHWGAKEAAYKLARQIDPRFVFSPARLVARFEPRSASSGERRGRLEVLAGPGGLPMTAELRSFETRDSVHVVARPAGADWEGVAMAVESVSDRNEEPGLAVRRLAVRESARELGVETGRLSIGRRGRIPFLELDGRPTALALSLSHHGRFVAYAMAPRGRSRIALRADRSEGDEDGAAGGRGQEVVQSSGFVGYPLGFADTAWMAG
jgi:hypothetical protein